MALLQNLQHIWNFVNNILLFFSDVSEMNVIGRDWVEITCPYNVEVVSSYKDRLWIVTDTNQMYTAKLQWTVPNNNK